MRKQCKRTTRIQWIAGGDVRRYKHNGGVPTPTSTTTRRLEYQNSGAGGRGMRKREAGNQKWGSGGGSHSTS